MSATIPLKHVLSTAKDHQVLRIVPELAAAVGLNESILLMQLAFWIKTSNNLRDGQWWTFQSVRDMQKKAFNFWSVATINRTAKSLAKMGYIIIESKYNAHKYDKTRWFALNISKLSQFDFLTIEVFQNETDLCQNDTGSNQNDTRSAQNDTTIPENPSENLYSENSTRESSSSVLANLEDVASTSKADDDDCLSIFDNSVIASLILDYGEDILRAVAGRVKNPKDISNPLAYLGSGCRRERDSRRYQEPQESLSDSSLGEPDSFEDILAWRAENPLTINYPVPLADPQWTDALDRLQKDCPDKFDTWFKDTQVIERIDNKLIVAVPNSYIRDMLQFRLYEEIEKVYQGEARYIEFRVQRMAEANA